MRRAIATAVLLAAVLAPPASAVSRCGPRIAWHGARYELVLTNGRAPLGPRLAGTAISISCSRTTTADTAHRVTVYAVRGVRTRVAIAVRPGKPALYVSDVTPTAAERRILARLRR
jgi:hypothetical protein